jgi:hypothetical protein
MAATLTKQQQDRIKDAVSNLDRAWILLKWVSDAPNAPNEVYGAKGQISEIIDDLKVLYKINEER